VFTIEHAVRYLNKIGKHKLTIDNSMTVSVQGFGKVGSIAALEMHKRGARVVAVADYLGGVYNKNGLNIPELMKYFEAKRTLVGFPGGDAMSNEEMLALPVDVMIPAAIDGVITDANVGKVNAKIIAEGANGPITNSATKQLEERGSFIIPDVLCNAGGVIVSYFEWVQGLQNFFWSEDEVNEKLAQVLEKAFHQVVAQREKYNCGMKTAALIQGVDRLNKAMLLRGLFP
jgi:glutamate dehydrogenase (NAD(P)+)